MPMPRALVCTVMWAVCGGGVAGEDTARLRSLTPAQAEELIQEDSLECEIRRPDRYALTPFGKAGKGEDGESMTVRIEGGQLDLNGLRAIDDETAAVLGRHRGDLYLDGLGTISHETAAALANHGGLLALNGLTNLSEETAELLGEHDGPLLFNGVHALEPGAAAKFHRHVSDLSLNGLETLSADAAKWLAGHPGTTHLLGLKRCSRAAYHRLELSNTRFPPEFVVDRTRDVVFLTGMGFGGRPRSPSLTEWVKLITDASGADIRIDRDAFRAVTVDPDTPLSVFPIPRSPGGDWPWDLEELVDCLAAAISGDRRGSIVVVREGETLVFTSGKAPKAETPE